MIKKYLSIVLLCALQSSSLLSMQPEEMNLSDKFGQLHLNDRPAIGAPLVISVDYSVHEELNGKRVAVLGTLKTICGINMLGRFTFSPLCNYIHKHPPEDGVTYFGYGNIFSFGENKVLRFCLHSSWVAKIEEYDGKRYAYVNDAAQDERILEKKVELSVPPFCPFMKWGQENILKYKDLIQAIGVYVSKMEFYFSGPGGYVERRADLIYYVKYNGEYYCIDYSSSPELRSQVASST